MEANGYFLIETPLQKKINISRHHVILIVFNLDAMFESDENSQIISLSLENNEIF